MVLLTELAVREALRLAAPSEVALLTATPVTVTPVPLTVTVVPPATKFVPVSVTATVVPWVP